MKRKLIKKLRSVKFWLSLAGAVVIALQLFGVKVSAPYINEVVSAVCSVFVVLGIMIPDAGEDDGATDGEETGNGPDADNPDQSQNAA
jgi:hypothetical protein